MSAGTTLRDAVAGAVHAPGDGEYDDARRPWQRKFDPRPALVVEPATVDDVRAALAYAREQDLPFAVQNSGHGAVAPIADGGVLLRVGRLNAVSVDPERATATAGGGAYWRDVLGPAGEHGLAPLSGSSAEVGVAGYTLGGGAGWLSRLYGFAADSLLRAEVVLAGGDLVTASADEHPELFWALRGGSGNFGVVTELEFRLYPGTPLYGGMAMFAAERARETLALYREWALGEPDELGTALALMTMPPAPTIPEPLRGRKVLMLRAIHAGPAAEAEALLAPLLEAAGEPIMSTLAEGAYADVTSLGPPPPPMATEMETEMLHEVPDDVIDALVDAAPPVSMVELRHWGGAMARPPAGSGPLGRRDVPFSVTVAAMTPDASGLPAAAAAVGPVAARILPYSAGGPFLNFLGDAGRTDTAYTRDDYRRLAEVKAQYDPDNVFSANHNVPPA